MSANLNSGTMVVQAEELRNFQHSQSSVESLTVNQPTPLYWKLGQKAQRSENIYRFHE